MKTEKISYLEVAASVLNLPKYQKIKLMKELECDIYKVETSKLDQEELDLLLSLFGEEASDRLKIK